MWSFNPQYSWTRMTPGAFAVPAGSRSAPLASLPLLALKVVLSMAREDTPRRGVVKREVVMPRSMLFLALLLSLAAGCDKKKGDAPPVATTAAKTVTIAV